MQSVAERPLTGEMAEAPFFGLALSRRSIRRYLDRPVDPALVTRLIEIAGRAPSAHNRQPWRWAVVSTPEVKASLAAAMGEAFRRDLVRDGLPVETVEEMVARSRARIGGAPVVIIPCLTMEEMDVYPDAERQHCEWLMAAQSVALAVGNLMLAAHAAGLGSCWICAPIFCPGVVCQALDLPAAWDSQGLITLGYPADNGRDRQRKPVEAVTVWR
ncbi:MAG: nitroreductase family protein [Ardenticatenaceae bacterium]|nr:nitroreductase family protein [Ardenticatenaceae bacterium]